MKKSLFGLFAIIAICFISTSCLFIRPYDKPEYVSIGTNETAFLIDQFADDKSENGQVKVNGDANYRSVNSKLVKIGHKWVQTGRMRGTGHYKMFSLILWIFVLIIWIGNLILRTRPHMKNVKGNNFQILIAVLFIILSIIQIATILNNKSAESETSVETVTPDEESIQNEYYEVY